MEMLSKTYYLKKRLLKKFGEISLVKKINNIYIGIFIFYIIIKKTIEFFSFSENYFLTII